MSSVTNLALQGESENIKRSMTTIHSLRFKRLSCYIKGWRCIPMCCPNCKSRSSLPTCCYRCHVINESMQLFGTCHIHERVEMEAGMAKHRFLTLAKVSRGAGFHRATSENTSRDLWFTAAPSLQVTVIA